ncbi:hypothetical protein IPJ91_03605 [bacterium]|nr:MAG: hypothetical protein IPJ91_03605 [bacterium]
MLKFSVNYNITNDPTKEIQLRELDDQIFEYCKFTMLEPEDDSFKVKQRLLYSELLSKTTLLGVGKYYLTEKIELFEDIIVDLRRMQYKPDQISKYSRENIMSE